MSSNIDKYHKEQAKKQKAYLEQYREIFERNKHLSLREIAGILNRDNIKTFRGYTWHSQQVRKALDILNIPRVKL